MDKPQQYRSITFGLGPKYLGRRHKAVSRNTLILLLTEDDEFESRLKNLFESGCNIQLVRHQLDDFGYLALFSLPYFAAFIDFSHSNLSAPSRLMTFANGGKIFESQPQDKVVLLFDSIGCDNVPTSIGWDRFSMCRDALFSDDGLASALEATHCPLDCKPLEHETRDFPDGSSLDGTVGDGLPA